MESFFKDYSGVRFYYSILKQNRHRLDGPAIEYNDGYKAWYIDGKHVNVNSQEEFKKSEQYKEFIRLEKLRAFE